MLTNMMIRYDSDLERLRSKNELPRLERYTDGKGRKKAMTSSVDAYKRLSEYEAIGLTPEIVAKLKAMWWYNEKV